MAENYCGIRKKENAGIERKSTRRRTTRMRKLIITILLFILSQHISGQKIEFRGLYSGVQTISTINKGERFYHSVYAIGLVGYKKVTFNTQFILPAFPLQRPLIKFGIDFKIL